MNTTISKSRNSTAHTQKPRPPEYIEFSSDFFFHGLVFPGRLIHLVASAIFALLIPIGALGGSGCRGNCSRPISLIHLDALPRQRMFPSFRLNLPECLVCALYLSFDIKNLFALTLDPQVILYLTRTYLCHSSLLLSGIWGSAGVHRKKGRRV